MSLSFVVPDNLKDALYTCILKALSSDTATRRSAEEQIRVLEVVSDYGLYLVEIALRKDATYEVRQMALALLKRFIEMNWSAIDSQHNCNAQTKHQIRKEITDGIKESHSKIRNSFAYCIAFIGCKDWPTQWPDFFEILNQILLSGNDFAALGVIRIFQEITREVDDNLVCAIVPVLVDQLCCIFNEEQKYSLQLRNESIYSLILLVNLVSTVKGVGTDMIIPKLPQLCEIFINNIQSKDTIIQDYEYKTNVIKFITLLVQKISEQIAPVLTSILPTVWGMVMTYGDMYINSVICKDDTSWEAENEEGKLVGFTPLVLAIFDFIHSVVDSSHINHILIDALPDIMYYVMIFMLITRQMERDWMNDVDRYIKDNSTESFDTSIRITARDVLLMICSDFDRDLVVSALCQALNRHISNCTNKEINTFWWWRTHEVCMYTLGLTREIVVSVFEHGRLDFDLQNYLSHWQIMPPPIQVNSHPLLMGSCIWFGAKYSNIISTDTYNNYVNMTLNCLRSENEVLRICAVSSISAFCGNFHRNRNIQPLTHYFPSVLDGLINVITIHQCPECVIIRGIKTMNVILKIDNEFARTMENKIITLILNLFMKYSHDPGIMRHIKITLKVYCSNCNCSHSIQEKMVPTLSGILNSAKEKIPPGIQVVAMDVLQTIVKSSKLSSEILIVVGFPAVVKIIIKSDDQLLMQSGGECLHWYLLVAADKVLNFTDPDGKSGLDYVLQATNKLLDPLFSENACMHVGKLIISIISKAGSMLETRIHVILRSILSKMQRAENMNAWQSLLMVFAYLFYTECEAIVSFLTAIPGPTGVSALEFVLNEWLGRESFFTGFYEQTLSTVGLCKLLEHTVTTQDRRFDNIMVKDEIISKNKSGERDKNEVTFSVIPALGKAFKIILQNLSFHIEKNDHSHGDFLKPSPIFRTIVKLKLISIKEETLTVM